jgi:hypothetical protein
MLRKIWQRLLGASKANSGRKTRPGRPRRRLSLESLEGRELLSVSIAISDTSFEVPVLAANTFQYTPQYSPGNGQPWQFAGGAGVSSTGSNFTSGNPNAPDGYQVAFLQGAGSSISQSGYLNAGTYSLSFMAAHRANQPQSQVIEVLIDGAPILVGGVPETITPTTTAYQSYQTGNFTVTAGTHSVEFLGLNPSGGDNTALIDEVTIVPEVNSISDGSFESPGLAAKTYQYLPNGSPWQFLGGAGVTNNGSNFTIGNPKAPDGTQVAFLQSAGSATQSLYLDAGSYSLSFSAAQRASNPHYEVIEVLVDGGSVGTIIPTISTNPSSGNTVYPYGPCQTANFTVTAGMHNVEFLGSNPLGGDNTAFIDEVAITAANVVGDSSFETPALAANAFQYTPQYSPATGQPWQFGPGTGVCANGSRFTCYNPDAPAGNQVAFIQSGSSMSQTMTMGAGTYSLSLQAAQRAAQSHYQEIEVLVDGAQVGTITPTSINYASYPMSFGITAAGTHTVEFLGLNPLGGDNTAFIDEVTITAANLASDDPSAWQFSAPAGANSDGSAFVQGGGSMSQSVPLPGGSYSLSFLAAQKAGQAQNQQIEALVDGAPVGTVTPASTSYASYQMSFAATAGVHTLEFLGLSPQGSTSTALIDAVAIVAQVNTISNGSFEVPALATYAYQYGPPGSSWQYSGQAGVTTNGSALTSLNRRAPDGNQAAFVQNGGSMSESVYMVAGTYSVSLQASQWASNATSQEFEVLIDPNSPGAQTVGTVTPRTSSSYGAYQTANFAVSAGMHTIELVGLNPLGGNNIAFIDEVALVPEVNTVNDGSFELPGLAANDYKYLPDALPGVPNNSPWQFSGSAGVSSNGSPFTSGNPVAPDGSQVAFVQQGGSMSQSLYLDAGAYSLSVLADQRAGQKHYQSIAVLVDGNPTPVGTIIPTPNSTTYASYTVNFTVAAAGTHTIKLVGLNPLGGDNTAFVDDVTITAANLIGNNSFEVPGLAANTFQYSPPVSAGQPWQFGAGTGVASNGSTFTSYNPVAPDGNQVAFIQSGGSMSQSVNLNAGTYTISFLAAQRAGQAHYQQIEVLVGGTSVGTITPSTTGYGAYETSSFTVTAGTFNIEFLGLNPWGGDNTALIDDVQL